MAERAALLESLRVVDLSRGDGDAVARILADLGADVLKVEAPGGSPARATLPRLAGTGVAFALHNANKRATVLDPESDVDRVRLFDLLAGADVLIDSGLPGFAAAFGSSAADLADRFEHLVVLSVTDFGTSGPRAHWRATDAVLYALSSALSRSGPPTGAPVLPPDGIASATAAVQATWAVLVAYYHRLRCGRGDYIDFSRYEAVLLALDPPFGSMGQAANAQRPDAWRGRPRSQDPYPIIACRDGYVRLTVMAPRQWHGLRAWMGEPEAYQDPRFDAVGQRFAAWGEIGALLAAQFADRTMDELAAEGQAYGVPIAAVLEPAQVLHAEHFRTVGALTDAELVPGVRTEVPVGYYNVDGRRAGFRTPAPAPGADLPEWPRAAQPDPPADNPPLPFTGVRIVDLGIIVAGGELSRLFGDLGAEVIKVESTQFPDGLRQTRPGQVMSESFAWTHRNNLALGLELRSADGVAVFADLVGRSDAVFANFKPGTLAGLGFSFEKLQEINPAVVLAESSAFGDTGPWSNRLGYGPLVRASTGVTSLWAGADAGDGRHPFFDATTVFPDHVVARITAIGALAGLIRRVHTGHGARIHVSQAEAGINQLDTLYVTRNARAEYPDLLEDVDPAVQNDGVYPCAGDDEWCVISLRGPADRAAAGAVIGSADNWQAWTSQRSPAAAAEELQRAGVAAAPMYRRPDVLADAHLAARGLYQQMTHPMIEGALPAESGPAPFRHIGPAPQRPAPVPGQDTVEICRDILEFDDARTTRLLAEGVLFTTPERTRT
ncbi:MAG: CoA transferase [Mycobacterium sp.]